MNDKIKFLISGQKTLYDILLNIVSWILWLAGAFALIYLIYGGIIYITAAGNEEKTKAGKNAIVYAIIGIAIVVLSFVIVNWIGDILLTKGPK
jgi:TRAP-type C4-dicarboxylate transport system permease small subunit